MDRPLRAAKSHAGDEIKKLLTSTRRPNGYRSLHSEPDAFTVALTEKQSSADTTKDEKTRDVQSKTSAADSSAQYIAVPVPRKSTRDQSVVSILDNVVDTTTSSERTTSTVLQNIENVQTVANKVSNPKITIAPQVATLPEAVTYAAVKEATLEPQPDKTRALLLREEFSTRKSTRLALSSVVSDHQGGSFQHTGGANQAPRAVKTTLSWSSKLSGDQPLIITKGEAIPLPQELEKEASSADAEQNSTLQENSNQELPTLPQIPQHGPFKHSQPRSFNSEHSDLSDPPSSLSDQDSPFATTAAARIRPVFTTSKPRTTIRRLIFTTTPREVDLQISRSKAIDEQGSKPATTTHKKKVSVAGKRDAVGEKVKRSGPNNPTGKNQWSKLRDLEKEAGVEELSGDSIDSFKKPAPNPKGRKQYSAARNPKDALTKRQEKLQRKENFEQRQLNNEEVAMRDNEHESPIQSGKEDIVPKFVSTRIHRNMARDAPRKTTRSAGMGDANMEDVMEHPVGLNANNESVQQETAQPSTRAPRPAVTLSDIDDIADTGIDEGSINASQGENIHEPRAADEQADSDVEMMDIPPRSRSPTSTVSSSIVIQDKGAGGDRPKRARSHPEIFSELYSSSRSATADKSIAKQETDVKDDSRTKSMLAPGSIPWATSRHRVTTAAPLRFTPLCKVQQADIIEISDSDVPNIPMLPGVPTTMTTPQSRAQLQYQQRTTNSASSSFSTNNMANTTVIDFAYVASAKAGTDTGTTPQQQALAEGQASQVEDVEDEEPLLKRARLDSAVVKVPPVLLAAEDDATHEEDPKISHPMIAASMQSQALSRPRSVTPVIPQLAHRQIHSPSSSPASLQSSLQLLRAASQGHQSQALPRPVYVQAIRTPPPPQRLNAPLKEDALALLRKEEFEMSCELLPDVATRTNRFSPALVNMGALIEHTVQGRKRTEADNITEQEPQADYDGVNIPMIPMVYPQSSNLKLGDAMERLRRTSVATKILNANRKEYGKASAEKDRASHTLPQGLKNTAIARLTMIKATEPQEVDMFGNHYQTRKHEHPYIDPVGDQCSFCNYVSDWGVTDSRVWLPIEAFPEFCTECNPDNHIQSSFFDSADFFSSSPSEPEPRPSDYVLESEKITERRIFGSDADKKANNGRPAAGVTRVKDMHSSRDVTDFQAIQTCRAHPSRQVDCRKAHICTPCLKEKIGVVKHRKHEKFVPISRCEVVIDGQVVMGFNNPNERICMVCQNLAEVRCENCPLRLCSGCETRLNRLCKGFLNNLFYHYGGAHLRNDAFLLRSDGGGF